MTGILFWPLHWTRTLTGYKSEGEYGTGFRLGLFVLLAGSLLMPSFAVAHSAQATAADVPATSTVRPAARLILLGTGGGPPIRSRRSEPASLLVVEGRVYLIDVGAGTLQRLRQAGFDAQQIDGIFITHHHLDHTAGLAEIIAYSATANRRQPVSIVGPPGTRAMVDASLALLEPSRRIFTAQGMVHAPAEIYVVKELTADGRAFTEGAVTVDAVVNSHFELTDPASESAKTDKSFSYRFATPQGSVVFTGDTGPDDGLVSFARGADLLVSEVVDVEAATAFAIRSYKVPEALWDRTRAHMSRAHLTPADVGKLAARANVGAVVLTHFLPGDDDETSVLPYIAGVREHYSGPVIAGVDLLEYDLLGRK